jgi:hypothetical protein
MPNPLIEGVHEIVLDTNHDFSGASAIKIIWENPNGNTGEWGATYSNGKVTADTLASEITIPGQWKFAIKATDTASGQPIYGSSFKQTFSNHI